LRPSNTRKLQFRSKRCVVLGYSNLHKGFKCLDVSEGRIYISRDVVFDETIFPFSELHPNAGARLHEEILLLLHTLQVLILTRLHISLLLFPVVQVKLLKQTEKKQALPGIISCQGPTWNTRGIFSPLRRQDLPWIQPPDRLHFQHRRLPLQARQVADSRPPTQRPLL
jgi:hypothetical protein